MTSEDVVRERIAGGTYGAIAAKHGMSIAMVRYYVRKAIKKGTVTTQQVRMRRLKPRQIIPPERYNTRWVQRAMRKIVVIPSGCWLWEGPVHPKGYAQTNYRGETVRIHRKLYELAHNVDLTPEQFVCHKCDVRNCINPAHIWLGDAARNNQDAGKKGRHHNSVKTHCPYGHAYDAENTYITPAGLRNCKACSRIDQRLKSGWPEKLAHSLPVTPPGQRPVAGRKT